MKIPSESQKQAITHLAGPAQIIAGPGSGKTFTIIQRILYLIKDCHVQPDKILVITYTRAAANEMKERFEKAVSSGFSGYGINNVHFGTFHSICYHILLQSGFSKSDSLIKENEKRKLFQIILENSGFVEKCTYEIISSIQNYISRIKNMPECDFAEADLKDINISFHQLMVIKKEYDQYLREQGMLDFDDMIAECLNLFTRFPTVLNRYQQMFEYILTDEFQDINLLQYQILKLLALPSCNLMVVGDDDQAIYGFRGAAPGIMKQFINDFGKGKQILLTKNYRSGSNIIKLAEHMISRNNERFAKKFQPVREGGKIVSACFDTRRDEEQRLILELSSSDKVQLIHTAVILRTNREVYQYRELLRNAGIDVKGKSVSDTDFFHSFIMEDVTAFLSFLFEGRNRSDFIRFMNKPNRFLTRSALPGEKVCENQLEEYYAHNKAMLLEIRLFFQQLSIAAGLSAFLSISFFRKTLGYERYLREKAKDYGEYQRYIRQADKVQNCFKDYQGALSLRKYITEQADQAGNSMPKMEETEGVSVLTMHGAKGLEFDRVFLPDVNEGIIPQKECIAENSIEEERRLLYVAITRAKNELHIYYTKERGRRLSRFLEGIIPPP